MRPERILELATLAVARRADVPQAAGESLSGLRERVVWLKMPLLPVSATEIRERVLRGLPIGDMVPREVEEGRQEMWWRLGRWGVSGALRRAGAAPGDRVRLGKVELEWPG